MSLDRAIQVAALAHSGQRDKAGEPYIFHALRVMFALSDDEARQAGVLHDVLEDSELTEQELRAEFPPRVVDAVVALTRRDGESYTAFIRRVGENPLARTVKLADIADNLDAARLARLDPREAIRLVAKYVRARKELGGAP